MMPLRLASQHLARRSAGGGAALVKRTSAVVQSRSAQTVPRYGTEEEMTAEAIEQIRARIQYQKALMQAREAHHTPAEEIAEMWRWVSITFWVGIPVCLLSAFYTIFFDEHPHRVDGELPEYMHVRSKEFPWECSDCDLFDGKCWQKCRAEKK